VLFVEQCHKKAVAACLWLSLLLVISLLARSIAKKTRHGGIDANSFVPPDGQEVECRLLDFNDMIVHMSR
jgi:hypothetical protein